MGVRQNNIGVLLRSHIACVLAICILLQSKIYIIYVYNIILITARNDILLFPNFSNFTRPTATMLNAPLSYYYYYYYYTESSTRIL